MGATFCTEKRAASAASNDDDVGAPSLFCAVCVAEDELLVGEAETVKLSVEKMEMTPDDDDSLGLALGELKEAIRLFRAGDATEASKHVEKAESLISAASPDSPSRQKMIDLTAYDPELKELKNVPKSEELDLSAALQDLVSDDDENETQEPDSNQAVSPEMDAEGGESGTPKMDCSLSFCGTPSGKLGDGTPKKGNRRSVERQQKLDDLEALLSETQALCRQARTFEANSSLDTLESLVTDAIMAAESNDTKMLGILQQFEAKMKALPVLIKLRQVHGRMVAAVKLLNTSTGKTKSEVKLEAKDDKLGKDFVLRMTIRFAEGDEREKDGPATQLIVRGEMINYPAELIQLITENIETDLFKKEWLKDCKSFFGKAGRAHQLFNSLAHGTLSPSLLPIKIDDVLLRDFSVDVDGVHTTRGSGVIVIEHRAPDGATEFEGIEIPPKKKGIVRIKGGMTAFFKSKGQKSGCSNICAVSTMGLPVPQWMLPLGLLKRFAADLLIGSSKLICEGLYSKWEESEYSKRKDACPDLYRLVDSLPVDKVDNQVVTRQIS